MWHNVLAAAALVVAVAAKTPAPVALTPSEWLGNDGNWSTVKLLVGVPAQPVNVLASNALSEFWTIGPGGCLPDDTTCIKLRGGIYTPSDSSDFSPLGTWSLGLDYLGFAANGQYGVDAVRNFGPLHDNAFAMSGALMSALNTTDYFLGYFGLGITEGSFNSKVVDSPLTQAVKTFGLIPSYSYGYTAGAHYRNSPVSVTLGGYDASRYVNNHDIEFTLTQSDKMPRALVRAIEITAADDASSTAGWDSNVQALSSFDSAFIASIDSTTPYMWLPGAVCEQLETALNLTYNSTFDLYVISNDQFDEFSDSDDFNLTFTLSSPDNSNDLGHPLDVDGVVNITVPLKAFVSTLTYPYMDGAVQYGQPSVPYLAFRESPDNTTLIIGRSFLQESYLITKFDQGVFSVHQAAFSSDAELMAIAQPDDSPYPPPHSPKKPGLSTGAMVGIAVGAVAAAIAIGVLAWLFFRRRTRAREAAVAEIKTTSKDSASSLVVDLPRTPISRILSRIIRRKRSRRPETQESSDQRPTEVPDTEIYELPAPLPPVELDGDDGDSMHNDEGIGLEDTQNESSYEQARRKMDRQLQGPVPRYTPPAGGVMLPPEKPIYEPPQPSYQQPTRPTSQDSSPSPVDADSGPDSLQGSLPSPISPRTDSNGHADIPSPIGGTLPLLPPSVRSGGSLGPVSPIRSTSRGNTLEQTSSNQSTTDTPSPISATSASLPPASAPLQRTPIDPSRVVYLGRLPENVQLPQHETLPRQVDSDGRSIPGSNSIAHNHGNSDSLGSNYTEYEQQLVDEMTHQGSQWQMRAGEAHERAETGHASHLQPPQPHTQGLSEHPQQSNVSGVPTSEERVDPGIEMIHVPQMAHKRYSWEEET